MSPEYDFMETQYQFAQYIRDPQNSRCPDGIETRRMKVYAELFYNNIEGFIRSNFPVFHSLTDKQTWVQLVRQFMVQYRCQSPIFSEIGREFIQFIQSDEFHHTPLSYKLNEFTEELLWYEYMELMVSIDKATIHWSASTDPDNTLLIKPLFISELTQLGEFSYPVHRISKHFIPLEADKQDTFLLVYRDRNHGVHFMELSPLANLLYQRILSQENSTAQETLEQLCNELAFQDTSEFINAGLSILQDWCKKDIIYTAEI